jgi:small subunit ribosomal protein S6
MVIEKETVKTPEASDELQSYELVVIFKGDLEPGAIEMTSHNFSRMITEKGGVVSQMDSWGKRKLAYPIKHSLEGNYVLYKFKASPAFNKELETSLRISEEVIRYLLIRVD